MRVLPCPRSTQRPLHTTAGLHVEATLPAVCHKHVFQADQVQGPQPTTAQVTQVASRSVHPKWTALPPNTPPMRQLPQPTPHHSWTQRCHYRGKGKETVTTFSKLPATHVHSFPRRRRRRRGFRLHVLPRNVHQTCILLVHVLVAFHDQLVSCRLVTMNRTNNPFVNFKLILDIAWSGQHLP